MPYMFTDFYNDWTGRPGGDLPWMSEEEARARYGKSVVIAVDAATVGPDGIPRPRWLVAVSRGAIVEFLDEHRRTWRRIDWEPVDGRWFRQKVADYFYPTDDRHYRVSEAELKVEARAKPDGTAYLTVLDRAAGQRSETEFHDVDVSTFWAVPPAFGEWDAFTDPGDDASRLSQDWIA